MEHPKTNSRKRTVAYSYSYGTPKEQQLKEDCCLLLLLWNTQRATVERRLLRTLTLTLIKHPKSISQKKTVAYSYSYGTLKEQKSKEDRCLLLPLFLWNTQRATVERRPSLTLTLTLMEHPKTNSRKKTVAYSYPY